MTYNSKYALNAYQDTRAHSASYANPHQLITMLMDGFLERVAIIRTKIAERRPAAQGKEFSQAISILDGLSGSLDHEVGGDLSNNLDALYDYMQRRLFHAVVNNDVQAAVEVSELMTEIREAWVQIPQEFHSGVAVPSSNSPETGAA